MIAEKTEHSPTPWTSHVGYQGRSVYILADGVTVANLEHGSFSQRVADAAYIVQAVNSHQALVDALENAVVLLNRHALDTNILAKELDRLDAARDQARAAIKLTKENAHD